MTVLDRAGPAPEPDQGDAPDGSGVHPSKSPIRRWPTVAAPIGGSIGLGTIAALAGSPPWLTAALAAAPAAVLTIRGISHAVADARRDHTHARSFRQQVDARQHQLQTQALLLDRMIDPTLTDKQRRRARKDWKQLTGLRRDDS